MKVSYIIRQAIVINAPFLLIQLSECMCLSMCVSTTSCNTHPDFIGVVWVVHTLTNVTVACRPRRHEQLKIIKEHLHWASDNKRQNHKARVTTEEQKDTGGNSIHNLLVLYCRALVWDETLLIAYLFKDEEVEEDHAEVVNNKCLAELEGLSVLHVLGPQPEEQQVGGADGQRGQGVVHQRPFLHPLVCGTEMLGALHNHSYCSQHTDTVWVQCQLI